MIWSIRSCACRREASGTERPGTRVGIISRSNGKRLGSCLELLGDNSRGFASPFQITGVNLSNLPRVQSFLRSTVLACAQWLSTPHHRSWGRE